MNSDRKPLAEALERAKNTVEQNFVGCRLGQGTYDLLAQHAAMRSGG